MTNTQPVWEILSRIPIGTLVAWIAVIATIITFICVGVLKLYKIFTKYKEIKDNNERQTQIINTHEKTLAEIDASLSAIRKSLDEQREVNLKQIRHTIVHTCEEAIDKGEISINKLRSLEEMYDEYVEVFHGNGYVKTLMNKVRKLKVIENN